MGPSPPGLPVHPLQQVLGQPEASAPPLPHGTLPTWGKSVVNEQRNGSKREEPQEMTRYCEYQMFLLVFAALSSAEPSSGAPARGRERAGSAAGAEATKAYLLIGLASSASYWSAVPRAVSTKNNSIHT